MEILDKIEPPTIPDGYGISIAYASLLEIIRSLQLTIGSHPPHDVGDEASVQPIKEREGVEEEEDKELYCQLIKSSWCGLLSALSPLIDASTDESITENILKAIQTYASLCGELKLDTPRDAFITAICKSSLPPHYALTVLNAVTTGTGLRTGIQCFFFVCKYVLIFYFLRASG